MRSSRKAVLISLLSSAAAVPMPAAAQTPDSRLELSLYRTRAAGGLTAVDAVAEIAPAGIVGGGECSYMVRVSISDAAGGPPVEDEWRRNASCEAVARNPGTRLIDTFSFAVRPGQYAVALTVSPTRGGQARTARATLESLPADAAASDLYLVREVGWDPEQQAEWPLRKGGIGLAVEAAIEVPQTRPFLGYYVEIYRPDSILVDGVVTGTVVRAGGRELTDFTLQTIDSLATDRPIAGTVSLAGLPVGTYELQMDVRFGDRSMATRRAPFRVVEEDAATMAAVAASQQVPGEVERYFDRLGDSAISRFDAVTLWVPASDETEEYAQLSPDAKRRFLTEYFGSRAVTLPDGSTLPGPAALAEFVSRINEADRLFSERTGDTKRPGWRTDRGRLYVRYGAPADRISRPFPGNATNPYEIWYYTIGRGYVYLFSDETGFGNYRMLYSTNPQETSLPGWQRRAGPDAVNELATYYGIEYDR